MNNGVLLFIAFITILTGFIACFVIAVLSERRIKKIKQAKQRN